MTVAPAPTLDVDHPAKFSQAVLDALDLIVPTGARVLDPFGGVGYIHRLEDRETVSLDLEPEWAMAWPGATSIQGNALTLPFPDGSFWWVVTSCTYGNRMADHHDAQERCKACRGTGDEVIELDGESVTFGDRPCPKCDGQGHRAYKRLTYRHQIGHELHAENTGRRQWGETYQSLHVESWAEVWRVLAPGGRFVLNVKNHWRDWTLQRVFEWHLTHLLQNGFALESLDVIETPGMGFGENRDAREPFEFLAVLIRT